MPVETQELWWMSASDLASAIRAKNLSPVEVVRTLLERIENVNPGINAYVTIAADSALAHAKKAEDAVMRGRRLGPLHGVPVAVKDTDFTKGIRTTMGSRLMENVVPDEDSVNVARLKQAGAIILGKTNTPEFACKGVTDNLIFGATCNPWDSGRTSGGSSGGSAAAVAAGLGPIATGSDAGGSIRIPSSCCGVVGFKPQFGRIPNYPLFHLYWSLLHQGTITRTVKDTAIMLDVMAGWHWGDRFSLPNHAVKFAKSLDGGVKGLKVSWSHDLGYGIVSREVRTICEKAVKRFSEMGAEVGEAHPDLGDPESSYATLMATELGARVALFGPLNDTKHRLHPLLVQRITPIQNLSAFEYLKAMFARQELAAKVGKFFEKYDLLLSPTIGVTAWPLGLPTGYMEEIDGKRVTGIGWLLSYPFNLTGHPAITVPAGWSKEGLPVGLQIVGRAYDEATVLRAAAAFEQEQPWTDRRPPL